MRRCTYRVWQRSPRNGLYNHRPHTHSYIIVSSLAKVNKRHIYIYAYKIYLPVYKMELLIIMHYNENIINKYILNRPIATYLHLELYIYI